MKTEITSVDQYIKSFPEEIQQVLKKVRAMMLRIAPEAVESISYGMPAYKTYGKPLVYFAAFKNHLGIYATPSGHAAFAEELSVYKQGKGSVQFPFDKTIPYDLIEKIIQFRAKENELKHQTKK